MTHQFKERAREIVNQTSVDEGMKHGGFIPIMTASALCRKVASALAAEREAALEEAALLIEDASSSGRPRKRTADAVRALKQSPGSGGGE